MNTSTLLKQVAERTESHLDVLAGDIENLKSQSELIARWAYRWTDALYAGGRLLVAGNGGSAAQAQHLTAELVGRYMSERRPLSAIALHTDTSSFTAISNDYGLDEVFARQVEAHGRTGDIFLGLSTSGESINVISATLRARKIGLETYAVTGTPICQLGSASDFHLPLPAATTGNVQELHLMFIHMICEAIDLILPSISDKSRKGLMSA